MTSSILPAVNIDLSSASTTVPQGRGAQVLRDAATQFESMLIASMLEKLHETVSGTDSPSDPAAGSLRSMAFQAVAAAITKSSGFGLSTFAVEHLANLAAEPQASNQVEIKDSSETADMKIARTGDL